MGGSMSIYDFADKFALSLRIVRPPKLKQEHIAPFQCFFENSFIEERLLDADGIVINGYGNLAEDSVADYVRKIKGKTLIVKEIATKFSLKKKAFREFAIPQNLTT